MSVDGRSDALDDPAVVERDRDEVAPAATSAHGTPLGLMSSDARVAVDARRRCRRTSVTRPASSMARLAAATRARGASRRSSSWRRRPCGIQTRIAPTAGCPTRSTGSRRDLDRVVAGRRAGTAAARRPPAARSGRGDVDRRRRRRADGDVLELDPGREVGRLDRSRRAGRARGRRSRGPRRSRGSGWVTRTGIVERQRRRGRRPATSASRRSTGRRRRGVADRAAAASRASPDRTSPGRGATAPRARRAPRRHGHATSPLHG